MRALPAECEGTHEASKLDLVPEQDAGAQRIKVAHPKLRAGGACPDCAWGKLYGLTEPSPILE